MITGPGVNSQQEERKWSDIGAEEAEDRGFNSFLKQTS
jgi:hypothetical protein